MNSWRGAGSISTSHAAAQEQHIRPEMLRMSARIRNVPLSSLAPRVIRLRSVLKLKTSSFILSEHSLIKSNEHGGPGPCQDELCLGHDHTATAGKCTFLSTLVSIAAHSACISARFPRYDSVRITRSGAASLSGGQGHSMGRRGMALQARLSVANKW